MLVLNLEEKKSNSPISFTSEGDVRLKELPNRLTVQNNQAEVLRSDLQTQPKSLKLAQAMSKIAPFESQYKDEPQARESRVLQ